MVARGVVVIGARADPVILVPTRVASLPAGAASTARAIVDMGALMGALVAPVDDARYGAWDSSPVGVPQLCATARTFFSDKTQARQTD